jgi:hypothetical protein
MVCEGKEWWYTSTKTRRGGGRDPASKAKREVFGRNYKKYKYKASSELGVA